MGTYRWTARFGVFEEADDGLDFPGGTHTSEDGQSFPKFANLLCNARLANGRLRARFEFSDTSKPATCAFIVRDNPEVGAFLTVGIGPPPNGYCLRVFDGRRWNDVKCAGDWDSLKPGRSYDVEVEIRGNRLIFLVDEVLLFQTNIPGAIPSSQVGIWCQSYDRIKIRGFQVEDSEPTAFVIMQYSEPYNALHAEVIKPVCRECGLVPIRADEEEGPGFILADVVRRIAEATVIIAEITPPNQNVFYELGYAHALGKPTILIAERGKQLPFDVSGMRTLFYENSIGGKTRIEAELRRHINAIMSQTP